MAADQDKLQFLVDMDVSGSLRNMQQFAAAYREMLSGAGDSPEIQAQLKQLDEWDAKLAALQGRMKETADTGTSAGSGLEAAGDGAGKADKSIASVRTATGALAGELGRITSMSPTLINSLQSMAFVGFNPLTLVIAGVTAALGLMVSGMSSARAEQERLKQQLAQSATETHGLIKAIEDYYQALEKGRGKKFFSRSEVELQGSIMSQALVDEDDSARIVALARDQGLSAAEAIQFANAYRNDPRRYTLDKQGLRRFRSADARHETFAFPTAEEMGSPTGRDLVARGTGLKAGYEEDAETRYRRAAEMLGMDKEEIEMSLGGGSFAWWRNAQARTQMQAEVRAGQKAQEAMRISRTSLHPTWTGVDVKDERPRINIGQQVNITTFDGRSPSLGLPPRGGMDGSY